MAKHLQRNVLRIKTSKGKELSDYINVLNIAFKDWIKGRVGTVHTFQDKEEKSVIFLLGLLERSKGAPFWASAKANISNVAVTLAKNNFYIVGSKKCGLAENISVKRMVFLRMQRIILLIRLQIVNLLS